MLTGNGGSLVNHVTTNVLCGSSSLFITICVSLLYIVYNGIFILILLWHEWVCSAGGLMLQKTIYYVSLCLGDKSNWLSKHILYWYNNNNPFYNLACACLCVCLLTYAELKVSDWVCMCVCVCVCLLTDAELKSDFSVGKIDDANSKLNTIQTNTNNAQLNSW